VRHETVPELSGFTDAACTRITHSNLLLSPPSGAVALLSEPLDGVDGAPLVTPAICARLRARWGVARTLLVSGRNPGPKKGVTTADLAEALASRGIRLVETLDHREAAPDLDAWVPLRRAILKRPFLAIVEKLAAPRVAIPGGTTSDNVSEPAAALLVLSAFHPSAVENILGAAESQGFRGILLVERGPEGALGFPATDTRPARVHVSARGARADRMNGGGGGFEYVRDMFEFGPADAGAAPGIPAREPLEGLTAEMNAALVVTALGLEDAAGDCEEALKESVGGKEVRLRPSGFVAYDKCLEVSIAGVDKAMEWLTAQGVFEAAI